MAAESEMQDYFRQAGSVVAAVYSAAMKGGEIQAFVRQGFNELGAATKAFPDSLQIDEPGAVFNPLYSDIAADKRSGIHGPDEAVTASLATPSQIAAGGMSPSPVHGESLAAGRDLPSPGDIARGDTPNRPEPDQGRDNGQEHGRSM